MTTLTKHWVRYRTYHAPMKLILAGIFSMVLSPQTLVAQWDPSQMTQDPSQMIWGPSQMMPTAGAMDRVQRHPYVRLAEVSQMTDEREMGRRFGEFMESFVGRMQEKRPAPSAPSQEPAPEVAPPPYPASPPGRGGYYPNAREWDYYRGGRDYGRGRDSYDDRYADDRYRDARERNWEYRGPVYDPWGARYWGNPYYDGWDGYNGYRGYADHGRYSWGPFDYWFGDMGGRGPWGGRGYSNRDGFGGSDNPWWDWGSGNGSRWPW